MVEFAQNVTALFARAFLATIFLVSGLNKVTDFAGSAEYMRREGMVAIPMFLVGATAIQLLGGSSLLLGLRARGGAFALVVFMIPATLIFHDFWNVPEETKFLQLAMFLRNLAITGGLLMVLAFGSGEWAIDRPRAER